MSEEGILNRIVGYEDSEDFDASIIDIGNLEHKLVGLECVKLLGLSHLLRCASRGYPDVDFSRECQDAPFYTMSESKEGVDVRAIPIETLPLIENIPPPLSLFICYCSTDGATFSLSASMTGTLRPAFIETRFSSRLGNSPERCSCILLESRASGRSIVFVGENETRGAISLPALLSGTLARAILSGLGLDIGECSKLGIYINFLRKGDVPKKEELVTRLIFQVLGGHA